MYNIAKVAKGEVLLFFNDIFDALAKVGAYRLYSWGNIDGQSSLRRTLSSRSRTVQNFSTG